MKRFFRCSPKIIGVLCLSVLLTGCIIGRYYEGPKIAEEKIKDKKPGITTKEEIISWWVAAELSQPNNF